MKPFTGFAQADSSKTIIGAVMDDFRNGGAYVGTSPWAYGGVYRPETQKANEFGMVWAGDPNHEAPGWKV